MSAEEAYKQGEFFYRGTGAPQDFVKAREWHTKGACLGYSKSQCLLGYMYAQGQGGEQDSSKAMEWFLKSAEQGNVSAQNNTGIMYSNGRGVPQDHKKAMLWFIKAADNGDTDAMSNIGYLYAKGLGVEQSYDEAMRWYLKAAEKDNKAAQHNVGHYYYNGCGVTKDHAKALEWFIKSAQLDHGGAQYMTGKMLYEGEGAAKDLVQAREWLTKAAKAGQKDAQLLLDRMTKEEENQLIQAAQNREQTQHEREEQQRQEHQAQQHQLKKEKEQHALELRQLREAQERHELERAQFQKQQRLMQEKEANLEAERKRVEELNQKLEVNRISELEIPASDLVLSTKLGEGTFGIVYKGEWHGMTVAIKALRADVVDAKVLGEFRKELEILMRMRHPNVVLLMGACTDPSKLMIVTEFMSGGSLDRVLRTVKLDVGAQQKIAFDIAQGMNYLHLKKVIHRDLKSLNVLLDPALNVKICDFGLSKATNNTMTVRVGTPLWMAPELFDEQPYNEKVDVYAYGIILWELMTGQFPWEKLTPMQLMRAVDRGERPPVPAHAPAVVATLMRACWAPDPAARPSFQQVLATLKTWV